MPDDGGEKKSAAQAADRSIPYGGFRELIDSRARTLLGVAAYLHDRPAAEADLPRPLLGALLSHATQLEELLDAHGAAHNRRWCRFRSYTAALKQFADLHYELLHVRYSLPSYQLSDVEEDFPAATDGAIALARQVLMRTSERILAEAGKLKLTIPRGGDFAGAHEEHLPEGRLPHDRKIRAVESARETVTRLATAFLSLAAESESVHVAGRAAPEEYASCFPDTVSEEKLRYLQQRFHNLQSLYDTYVSGTEAESLDSDLPVLRGHISVVYHLLTTATLLAHYYERHVNVPAGRSLPLREPLVTGDELLTPLMDYSIAHASRYLERGTQVCHAMLDRYAEIGRVEVPLPRYRGFHVRPSALVSKIVKHYGSDVRMELEGETYDASSPLELFRANEKISARKRRWLASEIGRLQLVSDEPERDFPSIVRGVVLTLAEHGKVVIYEQPVQVLEEAAMREGTLAEKVFDEIARLQTTGKIDVRADMDVTLVGDKRVLADIKLLAESGYGEDDFGNNVELPKELVYLRR